MSSQHYIVATIVATVLNYIFAILCVRSYIGDRYNYWPKWLAWLALVPPFGIFITGLLLVHLIFRFLRDLWEILTDGYFDKP